MKPFFEWCDSLPVSLGIRDSRVLFPAIECVHILALAVLLGSVVVLAIRLLGLGLMSQTIARVGTTLRPLTNWSLFVMFATGIPLFLSEATKLYENPPFFAKMLMLALAVLFQYIVVRPAVKGTPGKLRAVLTGTVSVCLWFSVGLAGRAIGFY